MEFGVSIELDESSSAGWNCIWKETEDNSYRIYPHKAIYIKYRLHLSLTLFLQYVIREGRNCIKF
jgi:hypothetical protein